MERHGGWPECLLEAACSCCAVMCWLDEKVAAVMVQVELGGCMADMPDMGRHAVAWDDVENREESNGVCDGAFGEQYGCGE